MMRFLIVDADADYRRTLRYYLEVEWPAAAISEHQPVSAGRLSATMPLEGLDALLLGFPERREDGLRWLDELRAQRGCPPILVFAANGDEFLAVDSLKGGASDYFPKARVTHRRLIDSIVTAVARHSDAVRGNRDPEDDWDLRGVKNHPFIARLHASDLSCVYLAQERDSERRLAYKVLRHVPDSGGEQLFDRFLQEYEVVAAIDHPNVVNIYSLGVADDHAYIAMEYLSGGTLADRLNAGVTRDEALGFARQIALALSAIHDAGILHRDLKPANIMLRADGSIALIDFGLAKQMWLEAAISGTGQIFGTPHYMSPEQGHAAPVDARSDIYSLGCIVYEMLSGQRPFAADTAMAVIYNHTHAPRPSLPPEFADLQPLVERMLAPAPEDRFQTMHELITWLDLPQPAAATG
jgi:ActR/RegA family two-component response regulator